MEIWLRNFLLFRETIDGPNRVALEAVIAPLLKQKGPYDLWVMIGLMEAWLALLHHISESSTGQRYNTMESLMKLLSTIHKRLKKKRENIRKRRSYHEKIQKEAEMKWQAKKRM